MEYYHKCSWALLTPHPTKIDAKQLLAFFYYRKYVIEYLGYKIYSLSIWQYIKQLFLLFF